MGHMEGIFFGEVWMSLEYYQKKKAYFITEIGEIKRFKHL